MENDYSFGCYKGGYVRDKETAKIIGEAVLVEKNLRGSGPLEITAEGTTVNDRLWIVREIGDSESGYSKASVVIYGFGDIKVIVHEN